MCGEGEGEGETDRQTERGGVERERQTDRGREVGPRAERVRIFINHVTVAWIQIPSESTGGTVQKTIGTKIKIKYG